MKSEKQRRNAIRPQRIFAEGVRKEVVREIESGKSSVLESSRELGVNISTIYRWVYRYSRYLEKNRVMVVEDKSEVSRTRELEKRLKEAEAALGRKQMEIDFLNKLIEFANDEFKTDIKKNLQNGPSPGSNSIRKKGTDTK